MDSTPPNRNERIRLATRRRRADEKQELRQEIIDTAVELFLKKGYEHFSLRQVAETIGYSPTTIYLYFKDKDELLYTVVHEGFLMFERQLSEAVLNIKSPEERLMALGQAYLKFGKENPRYYHMMFIQRPDFLEEYRKNHNPNTRIETIYLTKQILREMIDTGKILPGDLDAYSRVFWSSLHGLVSLTLIRPLTDKLGLAPFDIEADGKLILTLLLRGLVPDTAS